MKRKKLPKIQVNTVPNGYVLKFQGAKQPDGYMYFTPEKLLEGFMCHIGLKMTDQLNQDTMQDFIIAAMQWHDIEKNVREIERLKRELQAMTSKRNGLARQLIDERRYYRRLRDDLELVSEAAHDAATLDMPYKLAQTCLNRNPVRDDITLKSLGVTSESIDEPSTGIVQKTIEDVIKADM